MFGFYIFLYFLLYRSYHFSVSCLSFLSSLFVCVDSEKQCCMELGTGNATSRKPHRRLKNWVGRKAKTTPNSGWNRTMVVVREVFQVKDLCCFPRDQIHVFCSSNSKTNEEDQGAGEDLGL